MEYRLDIGAWGSVFAVPSLLVDQHIKLAGAAQLKVILWLLRHAGEDFDTADIAAALNMHEADVRDCMQYWINADLVAENTGVLTPPEPEEPQPEAQTEIQPEQPEAEQTAQTEESEKPPKRLLSRPEKPDQKYLAERMKTDNAVEYLMTMADEIFGRFTSVNDKETLLLIHEYDGIPVDVLIMLMQYAAGEGKCNMKYIEKMAISWADEEIFTIEAAERKIRELTERNNAAKRYQHILGLEAHSPTKKEKDFADLWINKRKFPDELIREAYELCIDNKGKFIQKYITSILESWFKAGITTKEQLRAQQSVKKKPAKGNTYDATYDLSLYENTSAIDDEGWDNE